ncbi:helix-turn-helix domain-containing protein [Prauserella alba]|uniref:HTH cro/C1-type domain-containing protein n=1 Tax=Prauserella alba TaxID=176898 RepID=A0ABP4G738_9PSEU|nr:helix-turn-helix transcriptional regulator [Prauserella alba]MCP2182124.1 Transcriptional regulator, contains XRE-family HTH domain [Prauserella alba]
MPDKRTALVRRRRAMGLTQEQLAAAVGMGTDRSTVYRWESGQTTPPARKQPRLAQVLRMSVADLIDVLSPNAQSGPANENMPGVAPPQSKAEDRWSSSELAAPRERTADIVPSQIPALRRVLSTRDFPADGPIRSLEQLRPVVASIVDKRLRANYGALAIEVPVLLTELYRAVAASSGDQRRRYAQLLVQVYRGADALADKYGYYDLSAHIIGLLGDAAVLTGDELIHASGSYVRGEVFFASGDLAAGRTMLVHAADRMSPSESETAAATYGSLHMRAAVLAARGGQAVDARAHIDEAMHVAQRVNEGVHLGTVFGPTSVRIHQLSLAVELGDVGAALRTATGWQPSHDLPAERRSHFYIDLARAYHLAGQSQQTLDALHTAQSVAPEHVRAHPQVRAIVTQLHLTHGRALQHGLHGLP